MNKNKLVLLTSCLGVGSIAIALVVTANRIDRRAMGYSLDPNATSKVLVLDLSKEHTFDGNKATEYALNENADNFGVEFTLMSLSAAEDSMAVVNNKTRLRANDAIFNAVPLSGVTKITVNGGNGNFHLFAGYSQTSMFEFLEAESNGGSRTFDNIPGLNYFRFEGKYDNYDCDISSIEFTYSAVGHECRYGEETPYTDITVKSGLYRKYAGEIEQHQAEITGNRLIFDTTQYIFANIVYQDKYLYTYDRSDNLLVSYSDDNLVIQDVNNPYSDKGGTYLKPQGATAVTMFMNGSEVAANSAESRMNVTVGDTFTFSAKTNAVPTEGPHVELVDETGVEVDPFVGTYTPRSTITITDYGYIWNSGEQFELEIDPIVITKVGTSYQAQYSDHGNGDYAGTSGTFAAHEDGSNRIAFEDSEGKLSVALNVKTSVIEFMYQDDDEGVIAMGDGYVDIAGETGATAKLESGVVTVLSAGDFYLLARSQSGITAKLYFHVNAYVPAVVSFDVAQKELVVGETYQINATVNNDATNKTLTYSSSRTSVATVSNTGLVTAKGEGSATITISTVDGSIATMTVMVSAAVSNETVYTFEDITGAEITVTVVEGVSITLDDGLEQYVFEFDSTASTYRYVGDEYCIVAIRKSGGVTYLDYADDECSVFGYSYIMLDDNGSVELTLA